MCLCLRGQETERGTERGTENYIIRVQHEEKARKCEKERSDQKMARDRDRKNKGEREREGDRDRDRETKKRIQKQIIHR